MNGWTLDYVCQLPQSVRAAALKMLKADQDALPNKP